MKTYLFDLDGTLFDTKGNDYKNAKPDHTMISIVNALYDQGNYIKIFTARGSTSGKDWKKLTKQQLKKYNIKYHELIFGKPSCDVIVDDIAVTPEQFLNSFDICPLCEAIKNEKELILYEDDEIVIMPTKYKKGHKKRIMIVPKQHISYDKISKEREEDYLKRFINFCKDYFDEEPTFCLAESTYASVKDHWHKVATDWIGEDMMQIWYTPHKAIATNVKWQPEVKKNVMVL